MMPPENTGSGRAGTTPVPFELLLCFTKSSNKDCDRPSPPSCRTRTRAAVRVRPCPEPRFGDYQANALMALAKARKINPRQLAADVAARLDMAEWCEPVEIAGAGFLNFRLKTPAIARALGERGARRAGAGGRKRTGPGPSSLISVPPTRPSRCTSGTFARPFWGIRWRGFRGCWDTGSMTDNHLGDWGTQFGKLIVGWKTRLDAGRPGARSHRGNGTALQTDQRRLRTGPKNPGKRAAGTGQTAKRRRGEFALLAAR